MGGAMSKLSEHTIAQLVWVGTRSLGMYVFYKFSSMQNDWMCDCRKEVQQVFDLVSRPGSVVGNVLLDPQFEHACRLYVICFTASKLLTPGLFTFSQKLWVPSCFLRVATGALRCLFLTAWCCPVAWSPNHAILALPKDSIVHIAVAVCFLQAGCATQVTHKQAVITIITGNLLFHALGSAVRETPMAWLHASLLLLFKTTQNARLGEDIKKLLYGAYAVNAMLPPATRGGVMSTSLLLTVVAVSRSEHEWELSWDALLTLVFSITLPNEQVIATPWELHDLNRSMQNHTELREMWTLLSNFTIPNNTLHELSVLCGLEPYVLRLGVWGLTSMLAFWSSDAQQTRSATLIIWIVRLCNLCYAFGLPPLLGFWLHPPHGYITTFPVAHQTCDGRQKVTFAAEALSQETDFLRFFVGKGWLW